MHVDHNDPRVDIAACRSRHKVSSVLAPDWVSANWNTPSSPGLSPSSARTLARLSDSRTADSFSFTCAPPPDEITPDPLRFGYAPRRVGAVEVELEEGRGLVLPDDLAPTRRPPPWVALLPALDPTTMGWKDRAWTLGAHGSALFDRNGNAGPTIWADGRIVGGWAVRPGGEIVTKLLEDVGRDASKAVEAETARWTTLLAGTAVVPRFPTPLSRQLLGSR